MSAMIKVAEGVFTDSAEAASEAATERELADHYGSQEWPYWNEEEGKWEL